MTLRSDLIAARALIDTPEKWAQGPGPWRFDRKCAEEATHYMGTKPPDAVSSALPLWWKVRQILLGRWSVLSSANIIRFNDALTTTHADVMALFQRAIDNAGERE